MTLLLRPQLLPTEGPLGYLLRLAEANRLSIADLKWLGIVFDQHLLTARGYLRNGPAGLTHASRIQSALEDYPSAWNRLTPRYCPHCLAASGAWRFDWELYWSDACAQHKVWLIDRCSACGERLNWQRSSLLRCPCGASLCRSKPVDCPDSIVQLSSLLSARAVGEVGQHSFSSLNMLSLGQAQRLIRLLGAYSDGGWQRKPQKILHADRLEVSWRISSLAAEYLSNGMDGIHQFLKQIYAHSEAPNDFQGRMQGRFGHFYALLYRAFSDADFIFLRTAFENFLAEHWQGAFGRRNRNLSHDLLERLAWMPVAPACKRLNISRQTLRNLVSAGRIAADERTSFKGRRFLMLRRADIEIEKVSRVNFVDLYEAAKLLGLKKCRFAAILPWLIPGATKGLGAWSIPREKIDRLLDQGIALRLRDDCEADQISLAYLFRYWPWPDQAIAKMFDAMLNGAIRPVGRSPENEGISGFVFHKSALENWYRDMYPVKPASLTIPEAAQILEIKQEVAYRLVRRGLLPTFKEKVGRRHLRRVSQTSLKEFRASYVFGRDLAEEMGTSPKALAARLDQLDIRPISGPSVDQGRQYLFLRSTLLDVAMDAIRFFGR